MTTMTHMDWSLAEVAKQPPLPNPIAESKARLERIDAYLSELGTAPYVEALGRATKANASALPFIASLITSAAIEFDGQVRATKTAAKFAGDRVPKSGYFEPGVRERAVSAAQRAEIDRFWAEHAKKHAEAKKEEASKIAAAAVETMTAAKKSYDLAHGEWTGPVARRIRNQISTDRLNQVVAIRDEQRTYLPTAMLQHLEQAIAAGDELDEDLHVLAIEPILTELQRLGTPKLASHLGIKTEVIDRGMSPALKREMEAIAKIQKRIEDRRVERMPMALKISRQVWSELLGVHSSVFGYNALLIDRSEYERHYLATSAPDPLAIHPGWVVRALPRSAPRECLPLPPAVASPWA